MRSPSVDGHRSFAVTVYLRIFAVSPTNKPTSQPIRRERRRRKRSRRRRSRRRRTRLANKRLRTSPLPGCSSNVSFAVILLKFRSRALLDRLPVCLCIGRLLRGGACLSACRHACTRARVPLCPLQRLTYSLGFFFRCNSRWRCGGIQTEKLLFGRRRKPFQKNGFDHDHSGGRASRLQRILATRERVPRTELLRMIEYHRWKFSRTQVSAASATSAKFRLRPRKREML